MHISSLRNVGTRIRRRNYIATIVHCTYEYVTILYDSLSEKPEVVSLSELESEFGKHTFFIKPEAGAKNLPKTMSAIEKIEIERRERYVNELKKQAKKNGVGGKKLRSLVIQQVSKGIGDLNPPSPATIARWAKDSKNDSLGVAGSILRTKNKRHSSCFEYLKPIAIVVFDEVFLKPSNPTMQYAYDVFVDRVKSEYGTDSTYPCYVTFINWIKSICPLESSIKKDGKKATKVIMRNVIAKFITTHPLQRVECDALHLAIGLRDESGQYLGAVTIFFVIDCYTRCILGYCLHIGKGEPSSCVIHAYRHALCPKSKDSYNQNCVNEWLMYGVFEAISCDGGAGYSSIQTISFLNTAGINATVVESYSGWKKPFVERFNNTVRTNFAQSIPSYCGHNRSAPQDKTIEQRASMTPEQFRALLELWIVDDYHQAPHSGIGNISPHQMWLKSFSDPTRGPLLPANYDLIRLPQGEQKFATISGTDCHQGVVINNVRYNDRDKKIKIIGLKLKELNQAPIVECLYSIADISSITVRDPFTDECFKVDAVDQRIRPGTTKAEFDCSYTKRYSDKGYGHKRVLSNSDEFHAAHEAHKKNPLLKCPTKQRKASPDQMTKAVTENIANNKSKRTIGNQFDEPAPNVSNQTGLSSIDFSSIQGYKHD